ncbi:MAG: YgfZ/GcvT domain-containing protein [Steroidobacterales bacterium]
MTGACSGRLPYLGLLRVTGADAAGFLQGQVSNDTGRLAEGSALLCAYSNAQGRVLAVMNLLPHSTGIVAILPAELLATTAAQLRKFILRSKVRIEEAAADLVVAGTCGAAALRAAGLPVPDGRMGYQEAQGIGIARVNDSAERYWVIGAPAQLDALGPDATIDAGSAWRLADIRAGLPQVYAGTSEAFVAQMLNLDLIDGISFTKGCYTGQEIVARTQHLGRIKRRMFRVAVGGGACGVPGVGAIVHLADGRSGRVTEAARSESGYEALAVLPIDAAAPGPDPAAAAPAASRIAATLLTLPYSLNGAP